MRSSASRLCERASVSQLLHAGAQVGPKCVRSHWTAIDRARQRLNSQLLQQTLKDQKKHLFFSFCQIKTGTKIENK
jgi:hypothetical protein